MNWIELNSIATVASMMQNRALVNQMCVYATLFGLFLYFIVVGLPAEINVDLRTS